MYLFRERSEFVTDAYKYSASVANCERISNILIDKHIRQHIRLSVRGGGVYFSHSSNIFISVCVCRYIFTSLHFLMYFSA